MGGGIGGLSLATALHRRGFEAELVERSAAWPAVGAGIALHANGVRVLRGLGLGEAIDQASAVLPRWSFHDQQGALLCETDLEGLWGEVGPCLGIARIRLQEILLGGAAAVPHRLGVAVTALTTDADRVLVGFSDGTSANFDLVVRADGISSTVRRLAVSPVEPAFAGTMAWRSVVPTRPPGVAQLMVLMGEGCFLGLVPVGGGGTYGFAGVDAPRFDDPCRDGWNGSGAASPASAGRFPRTWRPWGATSSSMSARSNGSSSTPGTPAGWSSSVTPPTPRHPTWGREAPWPWRTRSCSREPSGPPRPSRSPSTGTPPGADPVPPGCRSRAASRPRRGSCRRRSATPPSANAGTSCSATATGPSSRLL